MVYNTSLTFLQPNITFIKKKPKKNINNIIQIQHGSSNNSNYIRFTYSIYFEGNQYLHKKLFFTLILKILNDEDNFTILFNEFHNETPLIVIENCFLLVLANIT